jgi:HEPN domain-containing protein
MNRMDAAARLWAEQARYDLDTAGAMFNSGRYLYILFCCQQAVEKMLKSRIAVLSEELPPRVHQLVRLAELAKIEITEAQSDFLRELSAYYIQTRYPEEIADWGARLSRQEAQRVLDQTVEVLKWLESIR